MKKIPAIILSIVALIIIAPACKKLKTPEAIEERSRWVESMNDSIDYYEKLKTEVSTELDTVNSKIKLTLEEFQHINNPREVEGYYLLNGWSQKIPLTSTGIFARITQNMKLELLATLSGGNFTTISVSAGTSIMESETVPHDQALNYRHPSYTTVCFSGGKADSIAMFISQNVNKPITLSFSGGTGGKNFIIPENEKSMISGTWNLIALQSRARFLEKELWISSQKIDSFRRIIYKSTETDSVK